MKQIPKGPLRGKKIKVLVAMSGGVDSSVAAALLVADGYDVTGAFMVNYERDPLSISHLKGGETTIPPFKEGRGEVSCWFGDYQDALRVAAKLGIPLMRLNFVKEYKKTVLDYMYEEYRKGRTPNPDVLCNKFVKFGFWLEKAKELGFDKLATGHYARLGREIRNPKSEIRNKLQNQNYKLLQAKDANKDQTYFLHQLNQEQLKYVLFPIGDYLKSEVRSLARKYKLPTAEKEESMGICFVGEVPMKEFLLKKIKAKKGKIILSTGEVIGEHDGLPFYTIGQRSGLSRLPLLTKEGHRGGLPSFALSAANATATPLNLPLVRGEGDTRPLYVVDKDSKNNILIVGYEDDLLLYKKTAEVSEINWVGGLPPKFPLNCEVRLRHRQPLQKCEIRLQTTDYRLQKRAVVRSLLTVVHFKTPQRAVTQGQFAVFYKKGECLGGGVIN